MRNRYVAGALVLAVAVPALAGCDGDGRTPSASPTAIETSTPEETPTQPADQAIRDEDLAAQPGLRDFLERAGGELEQGAIIYSDLTADGVEEAIIPVASGGEGGPIAVFVLGYGASGLEELLRVLPDDSTLQAAVSNGVLEITEPVYGPDDPLCCPSELRVTPYEWDGSRFTPGEARTQPAGGG